MKKNFVLLLICVFVILNANAHVNLIYPTGGETFIAGETINIQWEIVISHNTENWDLFYSGDGGITWVPIKLDISIDSLNYQWIVPDTPTLQGQIRIVMDNVGNDYNDNSENFTIESVTTINEAFYGSGLKVFPNPMTENAVFTFANPDNKRHTLIFFNSEGKLVREMGDITTEHVLFNRNNLVSGLYFYQLRIKDEVLISGKIIIK